jgi:hypothetical protein
LRSASSRSPWRRARPRGARQSRAGGRRRQTSGEVQRLGHIPSSRCQAARRTMAAEPVTLNVGHLAQPSGTRPACRIRSASSDPRHGGARRDRTDDLLLAKQALSQLSYGPGLDPAALDLAASFQAPTPFAEEGHQHATSAVVGLERFELSTSRLSSARSNQLSYRPGKRGGCPNEERETKAAASRNRGFDKPPVFLSTRKEARPKRPRTSCFPASLERR